MGVVRSVKKWVMRLRGKDARYRVAYRVAMFDLFNKIERYVEAGIEQGRVPGEASSAWREMVNAVRTYEHAVRDHEASLK